MASSIWQKYEEIFPLVADLPKVERERRLRELCAGDATLYREILALLEADEKAGQFIESPIMLPNSLSQVFQFAQPEKSEINVAQGRQFGAYRVIRKLGAGGMGAVFLAERADGEFQKRVAVKLVRNGAETDFNLRRFRHERQILAQLEHPHIARLIDGGTTDEGLPFLVMEYVEGTALFDFCDARDLDLAERLRLFLQICQALEYAHQRRIIHRDVKPGNILVTAGGTVKLLDFGIAKILDADFMGEPIAQTETLMKQMTPEYASPEQVRGEKVTAASDVYSLGVVLYELVTGERPYKFASRAPHEIARVICEENVRISNFRYQAANADDLKFIILKTLRKKPSERYASARELEIDIERFLTGLPVLTESARLKYFEHATHGAPAGSISLVVAPFRILSPKYQETGNDEDFDAFLGIGLADALTTKLSGVRRLAVRPTSSVLRLATECDDAHRLGELTGADFVLEGHILRAGEQIRVSVQLLKTRDDSVLWAGQFDESSADFFRLQDSISERVAASLVPQLTTEEQELLHQQGTSDAGAFEAYLRGRVSFQTYTFEGIVASENYFQQAIAQDPNFALAYSGLADFYNWQSVAGLAAPAEGFNKAKDAAQQAIALNLQASEAYASLAFAVWAYDWDFALAENLFQKSIALNPNYVKAHEWFAYLLSSTGRHDEAREEMRRAELLDPNSPAVATMFAYILYNARLFEEGFEKNRRALALDPDYYLALQGLGWVCPPLGKFEEAIAGCRRAVEVSSDFSFNKLSLALALCDAGERDEARQIAGALEKGALDEHVPPYYPALLYAVLGETETAFRWFDRAIEKRGYWTLWMRVEPRLDHLRDDPRFIERLEKIEPLPNSKPTIELDSTPTAELAAPRAFRAGWAAAAAVVLFLIALGGARVYQSLEQRAPLQETVAPESPPLEAEKRRSKDSVANDLYSAGKQQLATRSTESINKAIKFFNEAAKRDPNFALAFSGLADAHILIATRKEKPPAEDYRKAEEYALQALALDPDLAEARISLGMAKFRNSGDAAQAEKHFQRAIEIDPSLAAAHHWYSVVLNETGRAEEALREMEIAARLDPRSAVIQAGLAGLYLRFKRYDEANVYYDKALACDDTYLLAYFWKSLNLQYLGKYDEALETYRKALIYSGNDENEPLWLLMQAQRNAFRGMRSESQAKLNQYFQGKVHKKNPLGYAIEVALVYNLLGEREKAFGWLEKVKFHKAKEAAYIIADPRFANLHEDERFSALVKKWQNIETEKPAKTS